MIDVSNLVKYAVIGGLAWLFFNFSFAIGVLIGAALYDLWKYWKN